MKQESERIVESCSNTLEKIRSKRPIVHNVTNLVVMNNTANSLLSIGASPIMAHAEEELAEMVALSKSVVLNSGTLDAFWVRSMKGALSYARKLGRPVVLDPVGAGASRFRTEAQLELLSIGGVSVLRGNASEILALAERNQSKSGGVDSLNSVDSALSAAQDLSLRNQCIVVVSGPVDLVVDQRASDRHRIARISNGNSMMTQVTGLGCSSTALIGAALGACGDPFVAAVAGMVFSGVAGELAANKSCGPGSFAVAYLDALASLTPAIIEKHARIEVMA